MSQTVRWLLSAVAENLATAPGRRVLDIGCGNGEFAERLVSLGYSVTGLDHDAALIERARSRLPSNAFYVEDASESLSSCGDGFDAVVAVEVLEHLYDPAGCLERARRALRPGGMLVVTTPYHGWLKNVLIALLGRFDAHVQSHRRGGHIKFFSRRSLHGLLEQAGFTVTRFQGVGRIPPLWASMVVAAQVQVRRVPSGPGRTGERG